MLIVVSNQANANVKTSETRIKHNKMVYQVIKTKLDSGEITIKEAQALYIKMRKCKNEDKET